MGLKGDRSYVSEIPSGRWLPLATDVSESDAAGGVLLSSRCAPPRACVVVA
jgi:hypothetical protein